jgi:hypothetical protein
MSAFVWKRAHTVVAAVAALVLVGGGIAFAVNRDRAEPPPAGPPTTTDLPSSSTTPKPTATPQPESKPTDPLTGGKVSGHPVIAVKVENIAAARPQVGLSQADIVFVEEVEGAQTRLVAIYHSTFPHRLGPVRSARSTDAELLPLFGKPGLVYSGANARVQRRLAAASLVLIYRETRDRSRVAPHNVFVDLAKIARAERPGKARPIGWTFAAEPGQSARPAKDGKLTSRIGHDVFGFRYSNGRYTVTWKGQRYVDGDSGAVTKADNVVVMRVRNVPDGNRDVLGSPSVLSKTVGKGAVTVYRDGRKIAGRWQRDKTSAPLRFTDSAGHTIALKPGHTWVTLQG